MEDSSIQLQMEICDEEEPLLGSSPKKGGTRTLPFIIANESFERLASNGLSPNMTRYLMVDYSMTAAQSSNVLYLWSSATGFTPVLGAFIADSYVGRYPMIGFGSIVCLMGMILLWLTAVIPLARPQSSNSPTILQLLLLFSSFGLMAIGAGGIRASSLAFGGDQLNSKNNNHGNAGALERFIGRYYVISLIGSLIGMTFIVYIQDKIGWNLGFGIPAVLMFFSMVFFFMASPFYAKMKPNPCLITGLLQVIAASYRKREVNLLSSEVCYYRDSRSTLFEPSGKLRFLNKACVVRDSEEEINPDPWSLCTVNQVEDLKSIIKIIPIWSAGIIFAVSFNQNTFSYLQVSSMDRHITSNFEIPTGSFSMFLFISLALWVALYDSLLIPLATRITRKPVRMKPRQKIGFGIILSCLSMATVAIVESKRRAMAIGEGSSSSDDNLNGNDHVVKMSAFWLLPHYIFAGIADASCIIGQNELFYSQLPKSMSSISTSLTGLSMSIGSLFASFVLTIVDNVTVSSDNESWVCSDINKGHYDYYFWLISGLCLFSFLYFVACSKSYGPCEGDEDE